VTDLPFQPREKLQQQGVQKLSTTELVALILGNGTLKTPLYALAEKVSEELANPHVSLQTLQGIHGIGLAKACQLLAMVEFVERVRPVGYPVIDQLQKVLDLVGELRYAQREHIVCLYLNTRLQLILKETLAIGSVNQSAITARDVFSVIKHHPISSLIFIHNHPSGNPEPSREDFQFTEQMTRAAELLGLEILDHVIIAATKHYSMKEHKVLAKVLN
jgi:DNA repair protein RadC